MATSSLISGMSRRLEGKVALITGGSSEIGAMTARVFAHHGAKVVIADIQDELGHSLAQSICPKTVAYIHCDVTNEPQVQNAVSTAVKTYGKVDIMFNNAGTMDAYKPRIIDNNTAEFERVLRVNVTGPFLSTKHAAHSMIPRRSGSIITTASISSYIGGVTLHAYTAAKHAVVGLTKSAAVELGQFGIRVNCLSPSAVATPQATGFLGLDYEGLEKLANEVANLKHVTLKSEDVANAALFLASEEGSFITSLVIGEPVYK